MPIAALDPAEDDALLCVARMRPELQSIISHGYKAETLLCAMTMNFAGLLRERGGDDKPLKRAMAALASSPAVVRKEVPNCHAQITAVIDAVKREGFSLDALLWSMLGAIISVYEGLGFAKDEIDRARNDMIMRINDARRLSTN